MLKLGRRLAGNWVEMARDGDEKQLISRDHLLELRRFLLATHIPNGWKRSQTEGLEDAQVIPIYHKSPNCTSFLFILYALSRHCLFG